MEFRILGQIELWIDGERHDLGSRKERCLLAILLWELGRPVPAETLVNRIWNDPSDIASDSLYPIVSRLRRKLSDASGRDGEEWLPRRPGSYVLKVSPEDVDVYQFRALRDQARAAAAHGDEGFAVTLYRAAEALWRGIPLDGLDCDWAERVQVRLEEERLTMQKDRIRAELQLGRCTDLVGEIADLAAQHRFDEDLIELLMQALYDAGRRAEALATYLDCRQRSQREFGGDPGPRLRDLHRRMLRDDASLRITSPRQATPYQAALPAIPPSTMPRDNPDFTGRTAELQRLASWLAPDRALASVPVVVISGMAGIGKTALAVHAAHQLRDRYPEQVFLPLRTHAADEEPLKPTAALGSLLRRMGVPDPVIPVDGEERAALLRYKLTGRNALIVLDDANDADQVLPLLPGTGCLVLVTTRHRGLSLPGMLALPLDLMPHMDAAAFFTRTAGTNTRGTAEHAAVSRVVRQCGHVPQRIQLAARQLRVHPAWSVTDLGSRLRDTGAVEGKMTTAFELSYRHLTADQQRLFRRLALHPGDSFSLHAAAALDDAASPDLTRQALDVLLDDYLIEEPVPGRFKFHDLIREYSAELTKVADGEQERRLAAGRLLRYYLSLVDHADRIVHAPSRRAPMDGLTDPAVLPQPRTRRECMEVMEAEKVSLLAVARYAAANDWPHHAGLFAHLLGGFLDTWGDWTDAIELHRRAIDAWRAVGHASGEAGALADLGFLLCRTGQHAEATRLVQAALALAQAASDEAGQASALNTMGIVLAWAGEYGEALDCHDRALAGWRRLGDRHGSAEALSHGVLPTIRLGRRADALRRAELALAAYRELGDPRGEGMVLNNLGGLQQEAHCYEEALASYEQAMAMAMGIGDRQGEAIARSNIGDIRRLAADYDAALRDYRVALSMFKDMGDRRSEAATLISMADAFASTGDHKAALDHYEHALVLASELAERHTQAASHLGMGAVHRAMGRPLSAAIDYRTALQLSQEIADPACEGRARYGLGCALVDTEDVPAAREHWRAALAIFEALGSAEADDVRARLTANAA